MTKEDREMASYIQSIIQSNVMEAICWGYTEPRAIKNGLMFSVTGLIHQGKVKVIYNEGKDLFDIQLLSVDNELKETIESIYFDELVSVLDRHIELVPKYNEVVRKMYGIVEPEKNENEGK